jgi:uncharacterized protein
VVCLKKVVDEWKYGNYELVLTREIYEEYLEIVEDLGKRHSAVLDPTLLDLIVKKASFVTGQRFKKQVCEAPDDDIFLEAAVASDAKIIVSGDKLLLACDGYKGVSVLKARDFVENYL